MSASSEEFVISLSDVWTSIKKRRKIVYWSTFACMLFMTLWQLMRAPHYIATGTFRDQPQTTSPLSLAQSLLSSKNDAISLMLSRKLMEPIVNTLHLQATLVPVDHPTNGAMQHFIDNCKIVYSSLTGQKRLALKDPIIDLQCSHVEYAQELPLSLAIHFQDDDQYDLIDPSGEIIHAALGEIVHGTGYKFSLERCTEASLQGRHFALTIFPLVEAASSLIDSVRIARTSRDPSIIQVSFSHPDRHLATDVVNQVMSGYETYLKQDKDRISQKQTEYLSKRQKETLEHLKNQMLENAAIQMQNLSQGHCFDLQSELDFLTSADTSYKKKLLKIDLECNYLEGLKREGASYADPYFASSDIASLLTDLSRLKQERASLDFALKKRSNEADGNFEAFFQVNIGEMSQCQKELETAQSLLSALESETTLPENSLESSFSPLDPWVQRVRLSKKAYEEAFSDAEKEAQQNRYQQEKSSLTAYLRNLEHIAQVRAKIIRERLSSNQGKEPQFAGLDLETAQSLCLEYNERLDEIEKDLLQLSYLFDDIKHPSFELSSLGTVLKDPVTQKRIVKAIELEVKQHDDKNQSTKDQQRLKHALDVERNFLASHIKQSIDLLQQHRQLVQTKIRALQEETLGLIQQNISVLEGELLSYAGTRKKSLEFEKTVYADHIKELHARMMHLPNKWVADQQVKLLTQMGINIIKAVAEEVEKKNIATQIDIIAAEPLDFAIPPTIPNTTRISLFAIFGAFLGCFFSVGFICISVLIRGMPASEGTFRLAQLPVAGKWSSAYCGKEEEVSEHDIEVLRQLLHNLECDGESRHEIALNLLSDGKDYSRHLAELLSKRGKRVLLVHASFNAAPQETAFHGLLQYLEGECSTPKIHTFSGIDIIYAGGSSKSSTELLSRPAFKELLHSLKNHYDCLMLSSSAPLSSAEALLLTHFADKISVSIGSETFQQLLPLRSLAAQKKVAFVFRED